MELYGPPKVGGDCLSYCGKCKIELAHVIVSMVHGKPAKVICKTCRGQHNYKGGLPVTSKSSRTSKPRVERTTVRAQDYWEEQMKKAKGTTRKYSPKETFKVGDVLDHIQFGMGIVEEVKPNGKLVALFRSGDKILVHGLGT